MKFTQFLKSLPLDSLMQMLAIGTQNFLESKRDCQAYNLSLMYQGVLDKIQFEIASKRAENPPLK